MLWFKQCRILKIFVKNVYIHTYNIVLVKQQKIWLAFKMVKNCTCLHRKYSLCTNVYSSSIQMDPASVWCVL